MSKRGSLQHGILKLHAVTSAQSMRLVTWEEFEREHKERTAHDAQPTVTAKLEDHHGHEEK